MRAVLLALLPLLLASPAAAAEWGGLRPGVTKLPEVRERYGPPSKESRPKVEGYDTIEWVYEGTRAPTGMNRLTVEFGMLANGVYEPTLIRIFTLEPHPAIYGRMTVIQGWGVPDGKTTAADGTTTLVWRSGLFVTLDKEETRAVSMTFSPPQPGLAPEGPAAPPPASPPAAAPKQ
jgi:hypothetical protein